MSRQPPARRYSRLQLNRQPSEAIDPHEGMSVLGRAVEQFKDSVATVTVPMAAVFVALAVHTMSFQMMAPVLPFITSLRLHEGPVALGYLRAFHCFIQLLGSAMSSHILSSYDLRFLLLLNVGGACVTHSLGLMASSITWLYAARMVIIFQHGLTASRVFISLSSGDRHRSGNIWLASVAYSFGLVVGPVVGGLLGEVGFLRLTPWTCFFMCMASFAVLYSSVDSSSLGKAYADPSDAPFVGNVRAGVAVVFETPALLSAFVCKALFMFTESLLLAVLPMGLVYTAGASMLTVGVVLSTVAATLAFTNAFVLPTLLSRFTDAALATGGCAVLATSAALLSFVATAPNPSMFWTSALAALWASATPVLSSVYSGQMSELPALDDADAVAALDTATSSVLRIFAHLLSGNLLTSFVLSPYAVCVCLSAVLLAMSQRQPPSRFKAD